MSDLVTYEPGAFTREVERLAGKSNGSRKVQKIAKTAQKRVGRPGKLTPAMAVRIVSIVAEGNYPRVACGVVGVTKRQFDRWKERGRNALEAAEVNSLEDVKEEDLLYAEFLLMVEMAESGSERSLLATFLEGGRDSGNAMTVMERRWRGRWSKQGEVDQSRASQTAVVINLPSPDPERQARVASVLQQSGAIEGTAEEIPESAPSEIEASPEVSINGGQASVIDLEQERAAREVEDDI